MSLFNVRMALVLTSFLLSFPAALGAQGPFRDGDVFASVEEGRLVRFSSSGNFREILETPGGSGPLTGVCFSTDNHLYVTYFGNRSMSHFDPQGRLVDSDWGGPFDGSPESCVVDGNDHIYVGEVDGTDTVRKFDRGGRLLESYRFETGPRGIDWIDLAADQCTMYYTSEGSEVKSYDVCRKRQLPDFAQGLSGLCYALRVRENGELLVTCEGGVYRLNSRGTTINVYRFNRSDLFSMNLDPDGSHFWVAPHSGEVYKVNIDTGSGTSRPVFNAADRFREGGLLELFFGGPVVGGLAVYGERTAAKAESLRKAEEEAALRKAEEDARRKAEEVARRKAEEEARRKAEEEARRKAEEEARRKAEEEARRKAEEEARRKAEEEARRKAEEEARRRGKVTFGPSTPLSLGKLEADDVATGVLNLDGTHLEGSATGLVTTSLKGRGLALEVETPEGWKKLGSRDVELPIDGGGQREWAVRLRIGSCAPGIPADASHALFVEAPGLDGATARLRVPISVTVVRTPGLLCWWPVLAGALGLIGTFAVVYGLISPARFPPRLGVMLSPEEDMNEGFFHPIRQQRGSGAGFYSDARVYVSADFRLQSRAAGALARLRADRGGTHVKPMHGAQIYRQTVDGEWEELASQESRVRPGTVYRDELRTIFFELRNG